jgi:hypothetical protein
MTPDFARYRAHLPSAIFVLQLVQRHLTKAPKQSGILAGMNHVRAAGFLTLLLLTTVLVRAQITQDEIQVYTPTAPWIVVFQGKNLSLKDVKIKSAEGSGYFLMVDNDSQINFSLYIEPVDKCKSSDECRDYILGLGNPRWGKYQDLAKGKVGEFSYFEFYRPEVDGQPVKMLDMYGQYVDKGYWIDLHISKVLYKKEEHAMFENLIKGIKFVPKVGKAVGLAAEALKIDAAATSWLKLWDATNCKETYNTLTTVSRQAVTEEQWTPYCQGIQKDLGKLQSRTLIASSLIKSVPAKPDLAGAMFAYRSIFEKAAVVELVSFTREADGRWTVSNYIPR